VNSLNEKLIEIITRQKKEVLTINMLKRSTRYLFNNRQRFASSSTKLYQKNSTSRFFSTINYRQQATTTEEAIERESIEFDVLIVGGGPSGLTAAIKLKQLSPELNVCLIDKGESIGAHTLSGACMEPRSLYELFGKDDLEGAPLHTPATKDKIYFMTEKHAIPLPNIPQMHNEGNYIISLGQMGKWLSKRAEELGVEIYTGFPGADVLYNEKGEVKGVVTADQGIAKDGSIKDTFQPGMELHAKMTMFAEGCRGSLTKKLYANPQFNLREGSMPQTFGLGLKEVWEVDNELFEKGLVSHGFGWPLQNTYGGSWMYHYEQNKISVGFVIGLDYTNPTLSPYQEFQRFKHHPKIAPYFKNGKCIAYGARTLVEGGYQSLPSKLAFPGGVLVGDTAGFLNMPKIKGIHTAMKSGMLGAEAVHEAFQKGSNFADTYNERFKSSWLHEELYKVRNMRQYWQFGTIPGMILSGLDSIFLRSNTPWTLKMTHSDNEMTKKLDQVTPIKYPKPDGVLSFDLLTNLARSGTNHDHDQPAHLKVINPAVPVEVNLKEYGGPEQYYCPAKVYEFVRNDKDEPRLQINAQNCLHCKACDIKDPTQNINWTTPEGGGGPSYNIM
jgi:electron-transferring-flavoprotein dehydrogenase